jgi:hypothetical protein
MSIYYYAVDANKDHLFDNFPQDCLKLIGPFKESQRVFTIQIEHKVFDARIGRKSNSFGTIYTLTTEPKFVARYKLFKELLDMSLIALNPLTVFKTRIEQQQLERAEDFIHNLTSLHSYSLQELFSLIPQNLLSQNINKQKDIVKNILGDKPNVATTTLLNLIKYNVAIKIEFSVF